MKGFCHLCAFIIELQIKQVSMKQCSCEKTIQSHRKIDQNFKTHIRFLYGRYKERPLKETLLHK